jgi:hypothetical protein
VPTGFAIAQNFGSNTLAPNETTTFVVRLTAASLGSPSGSLSFTNNDPDENPFNFTVSGTVTAVPAPEIEVRDGATVLVNGNSTVNYGSTTEGTPLNRTFTVQNTGTANLTLADLAVPAGFQIVSNFGSITLAPTQSTTFTVRLTAAITGTFSGNVSFTNNDADENPFSFVVQGNVTATPEASLVVEQASTAVTNGGTFDFGTAVGGSPITRLFTVRNNGTAALTLADLAVTGTGFSISQPFGQTSLPVGESTTFAIQLNADTIGAANATVSFTNNAPGQSPFSFTVSGTVTAPPTPEIELLDGATNIPLNGTVQMGTTVVGTAVVKTFTIRNIGSQALTVETPVLPAGYTLLTTPTSTIAAGASSTFQVQLDATSAGTFAGQVSLGNNDGDENPFTFTLTGVVEEEPAGNPRIFLPFISR